MRNKSSDLAVPTQDVVEASLSRILAELESGEIELKDSDVRREKAVFASYMSTSDLLKDYFLQVVVTLYDTSGTRPTTDENPQRLRRLFLQGRVTEDQIAMLLETCSSLFFCGWHSRGAESEAEELQKMMDTNPNDRQSGRLI